MQEYKVIDPDGVRREYAFDDACGALYQRTQESRRVNPGRPYFLVTHMGDYGREVRVTWEHNQQRVAEERYHGACYECRTVLLAVELLWQRPERAKELLSLPPPQNHYRFASAY